MSEKEKLLVMEIKKLSQKEGLTDAEVASLLGYSPSYIKKLRVKWKIPKRNINVRKDKENICTKCGKIKYIRRNERKTRYCEACLSE